VRSPSPPFLLHRKNHSALSPAFPPLGQSLSSATGTWTPINRLVTAPARSNACRVSGFPDESMLVSRSSNRPLFTPSPSPHVPGSLLNCPDQACDVLPPPARSSGIPSLTTIVYFPPLFLIIFSLFPLIGHRCFTDFRASGSPLGASLVAAVLSDQKDVFLKHVRFFPSSLSPRPLGLPLAVWAFGSGVHLRLKPLIQHQCGRPRVR